MKKIFQVCLIGLALICSQSCKKSDDVKENVIASTEIKLDKTEINLVEGTNTEIKVQVLPESTSDKTVIWTSTNEEIARVDNGKVSAIKEGKAIITAKNGKVNNSCTINVSKKAIEVESISLDISELSLELRKAKTLKASILPTTATDKTLVWSSSDEKVATVDNNGKVKAVKEGVCEIKVESKNGKSAVCKTTIIYAPITVTSIEIEKDFYEIKIGDKIKIIAKALPADAEDKSLSIEIEDTKILSVKDGEFTALAEGSTSVIFRSTAKPSIFSSCVVFVEKEGEEGDCVDPSGKSYKTVKIGNQEWMAENYAYLPKLHIKTDTTALESRCYIADNSITDIDEAKKSEGYILYGVYYNYKAALEYCPKGWHLPTLEDWTELETNLGMTKEEIEKIYDYRGTVASKLKSTTGWRDDKNGSNSSGFNALPAGYTSAGKNMIMWNTKKATFMLNDFCLGNPHEIVTRTMKYTEEGIEDWYILASQGTSVRYIKNK